MQSDKSKVTWQVESIAIAIQPSERQELVTDEDLADTATLLQACENVEMLADLRACCFDFIIKKALELVSSAQKDWVFSWLNYWEAEGILT